MSSINYAKARADPSRRVVAATNGFRAPLARALEPGGLERRS